MIEWGSDQAIISEINENGEIPFISNILGDTCPPNYSHQITIYGQNFRPDSTVNIPGVTNIVATVFSPTEIIARFTSGSIVGAFDVEVRNGEKSSLLWGQNNKLNIIIFTGGNLPLLNTWIDCRVNGSPDSMIGEIFKDTNSTWTRGVFGYVLTALSSTASNWFFFLRFSSFSFSLDIPLSAEFIIYNATYSGNYRWGLHPQTDSTVNAANGFLYLPHQSNHYYVAGWNASPGLYGLAQYNPGVYPANTYTKIIMKPGYIAFCTCDPSTFDTLSRTKEYFINKDSWNSILSAIKAAGFSKWEFGLKFNPTGVNVSNYSHLTAFKLSWA